MILMVVGFSSNIHNGRGNRQHRRILILNELGDTLTKFEALLLLPRVYKNPGNPYVRWRKLHACAIFFGGIFVDNALHMEINPVYYDYIE